MYIFVYGTLKKGFSNYDILKNLLKTEEYLDVTTVEKYPLYQLFDPFPYLEDKPNFGNNIKGQLFQIIHKNEEKLDYFEGVPFLYKKGMITVIDENNVVYKNVNVYFAAKELISFENVKLLKEFLE